MVQVEEITIVQYVEGLTRVIDVFGGVSEIASTAGPQETSPPLFFFFPQSRLSIPHNPNVMFAKFGCSTPKTHATGPVSAKLALNKGASLLAK